MRLILMSIILPSLLLLTLSHASAQLSAGQDNKDFSELYESAFPDKGYERSRQKYQKALKLLKQGKLKAFKKLSEQLTDYPLYPYLQYYQFKKNLSQVEPAKFTAYFKNYSDSPTAQWLRNAWLADLAARKEWPMYIKYYTATKDPTRGCHFYWALYQTGRTAAAFQGAKKLWLVGQSQPNECDPLFKVWRASDQFKEAYIWQRISLSIRKGKVSLAKYLAQSLPTHTQPLVSLWVKVRSNPKILKNASLFKDTPKHREIILYGLGRIAFNDLDTALHLWNHYMAGFQFQETELEKPRAYIAKLLAFSFHSEAALWLERANNDLQDQDLHERQIRIELRKEDWNTVIKWITLLPDELQEKSIWQYWRARALQSLATIRGSELIQQDYFPAKIVSRIPTHRNLMAIHINFINNFTANLSFDYLVPQLLGVNFIQKSNEEAKAIFEKLSSQRHFYGFLASQFLSRPVSLNLDNIQVTAKKLNNLAQFKGILRARELLYVGAELSSQREWVHLIQHLNREERAIAAKLAAHWKWPFYAIYTASRSNNTNDIDLRFPRYYHNIVSKQAQKNDIATEWVFSIIRQESAFRKQAKSHVGALGMMQLMPSTAKYVAKKIGEKYGGNHTLLDPEKNIQLGSSYLKQLLDRFDGNLLLATAAYNAGPHRSIQWRPKSDPIKGDIWIETIPIKETREYVKNVIAYQAIYQYQLGYNPELTKSLQQVDPLLSQEIH